jgi:hypothetical protein
MLPGICMHRIFTLHNKMIWFAECHFWPRVCENYFALIDIGMTPNK